MGSKWLKPDRIKGLLFTIIGGVWLLIFYFLIGVRTCPAALGSSCPDPLVAEKPLLVAFTGFISLILIYILVAGFVAGLRRIIDNLF